MRAPPAVTDPVLTAETIRRRRSEPVSLKTVLVLIKVKMRDRAMRMSTAAAQLEERGKGSGIKVSVRWKPRRDWGKMAHLSQRMTMFVSSVNISIASESDF